MNSPLATEWRQEMEEEMKSLKENDTFELTTLPMGTNPVGGGGGGNGSTPSKKMQKGLKHLKPDM